jgi:hypothetical protein
MVAGVHPGDRPRFGGTDRGRGGTDSRCHQHDLPQHPVDEPWRLVGGQLLGQLDRLVDGDGLGHVVGVQQFPHRDAQECPVHGGQPFQRPALQVRTDQVVDMRGVPGDPVRHGQGVRIEFGDIGIRRSQGDPSVGDLGGGQPAGLGLEEQVDGAFAGLMAALGPAFFRFAVSHG